MHVALECENCHYRIKYNHETSSTINCGKIGLVTALKGISSDSFFLVLIEERHFEAKKKLCFKFVKYL